MIAPALFIAKALVLARAADERRIARYPAYFEPTGRSYKIVVKEEDNGNSFQPALQPACWC